MEPGLDVVTVVLVGQLDVMGAGKIDLQFNAAGAHRDVIVDMAGVDFLASIGIRTLVVGAKTVQRRGGTLVLWRDRRRAGQSPPARRDIEDTGAGRMAPVTRTPTRAIALRYAATSRRGGGAVEL